jgi:hypothetical protein
MYLKQVFAILLLFVMLFNMAGYRVLYYFVEKQATAKLESAIEKGNFDESSLVEIKIPLNMPYYSDMPYEVAYGEAELNGKKYRFVKRKVSGNILHLLCLPHLEKDKLLIAKKIFDGVGNKTDAEKSNTNFLKLFQVEFVETVNKICLDNCNEEAIKTYVLKNNNNKDLFIAKTIAQPPEFIS